ncbi:hypothetical protein [Natrialba aegyptia]|uniref:Uncharacterized protein n=1 Tax=Natrialba aegyptia DSM 13077 TaxID=1227491 RepID=M0AZZ1_9EURY|nr:hypothetical protein [Natrialba aegyptia]ELZ04236.1 hypothetical protein C480_12006 [Natrialba aegyptia DSM 13077]
MSALRPHIHLFLDELPGEPVRSAVRRIQDSGFSTVSTDSSQEFVFGTWGQDEVGYSGWETTAELQFLVDRIRSVGRGRIKFWSPENHEYQLSVRLLETEMRVSAPVRIWGPPARIFDTDEYTRETVEKRTELLVTLFLELSERFDPWYAFADIYDDRPKRIFPADRPPESGLERLPWITVFGLEWFDFFGGADRTKRAPAWNVRQLATGSVVVRERDFPAPTYAECDSGPPISTYEYLFERRSIAELRSERRRKRNTIVDPFREFAPGERGSDIVLCKGHASIETTEIDYRDVATTIGESDNCYVLHVYRDDRDQLREVNSGLFVRRLIDEDGQPIGTLPDDVPLERELLSLSVNTAVEPFPPEMYRMESAAEPSVIAKLFGLWELPPDGTVWAEGDTCRRRATDPN